MLQLTSRLFRWRMKMPPGVISRQSSTGGIILGDPEGFPPVVGKFGAVTEADNGVLQQEVNEVRIKVPWGTIAGKTWGDPSGIPVLGLHGWMDNAGTFDKLAPLLLKSLFFVAVEMPGHGFSSHYPPGMPYHFIDYTLVVRRIVRHLGWNKFSIIGHSMGAGIAALYSAVFPQEVDQLVLLDFARPIIGGSGNMESKIAVGIDLFLAVEEKMDPTPPTYTYEDALNRLRRATQNALTEESARTLLMRGARQVDEDKFCFTRDLRLRSQTLGGFGGKGVIPSRVLYLKAKDAPVYVQPGIQDEALQVYKSRCAEFNCIEVEGNHFFHLNDPTQAAGLINEFFMKQKKALL